MTLEELEKLLASMPAKEKKNQASVFVVANTAYKAIIHMPAKWNLWRLGLTGESGQIVIVDAD